MAPDFDSEFEKSLSGYTFFISNKYKQDKDKESLCIHKDQNNKNKIFLNVRDSVPIDYLDKMTDRQKDIKLQCE